MTYRYNHCCPLLVCSVTAFLLISLDSIYFLSSTVMEKVGNGGRRKTYELQQLDTLLERGASARCIFSKRLFKVVINKCPATNHDSNMTFNIVHFLDEIKNILHQETLRNTSSVFLCQDINVTEHSQCKNISITCLPPFCVEMIVYLLLSQTEMNWSDPMSCPKANEIFSYFKM